MTERKEFIKKFFAGSFFLIGMFLILLAIFVIGKDKGFTQPKFQIAILFKDVGGLIEGAPVQLAGVNVGTVSHISFLDKAVQGRRVKVKVNIFDRYKKQLSQEVRFNIKTEGILGGKFVEINIEKGGHKVDFDQPMFGDDPLNVQDLAQVFADAAEAFTKTSEDFSKIDVQELSKVLSETAKSLAKTAKGINTVLTEMHYISIKSKRLLDRVEQRIIDGNLFKVF
jgi:phospholipid/cholesterol/gamma-HCH transport system substrate-binding protein